MIPLITVILIFFYDISASIIGDKELKEIDLLVVGLDSRLYDYIFLSSFFSDCAIVCGHRSSIPATRRSIRQCTTSRVCRTCANVQQSTVTANLS